LTSFVIQEPVADNDRNDQLRHLKRCKRPPPPFGLRNLGSLQDDSEPTQALTLFPYCPFECWLPFQGRTPFVHIALMGVFHRRGDRRHLDRYPADSCLSME
jgi:hypothetical protein